MTDRPLNGSPEWDAVADADFGSDSHRGEVCSCLTVLAASLIAWGAILYAAIHTFAAALR